MTSWIDLSEQVGQTCLKGWTDLKLKTSRTKQPIKGGTNNDKACVIDNTGNHVWCLTDSHTLIETTTQAMILYV